MTEKTTTDPSKNDEAEIAVDAVPVSNNTAAAAAASASPIPPGHSRFYCHKCHAPYDLPDKATTWRCPNCSTFNSTTRGECEWCNIV